MFNRIVNLPQHLRKVVGPGLHTDVKLQGIAQAIDPRWHRSRGPEPFARLIQSARYFTNASRPAEGLGELLAVD
jgi:hypothetical protein